MDANNRLSNDNYLIIYAVLSYCYFHFVNLCVTARRIRLLLELKEADEGLTYDEVLRRYNAEYMVNVRLERLVDSGQLTCTAGRYYIGNPIMSWAAKIILFMKLLVLGKKSEFD